MVLGKASAEMCIYDELNKCNRIVLYLVSDHLISSEKYRQALLRLVEPSSIRIYHEV